MSLAEYVPTAWTDYADSPDLEASFLNHIELGIDAVTDELIAFEAWAAAHYQPVSAELTAIAGLSSPGYVRRTGPGTYVTVASIPQADVAGGPFLPLAAGAANVLTGPVYSGGSLANIPAAPLNLVNGAQGVMKTQLNLVNTAGFPGAGSAIDFFTYDQAGGTLPGVRIGAVDDNWSASFSVWTKTPGAASNPLVERLKISNAGLVTLSSLGAGFVRSSSAGLLSSSALAAADIPSLDASKITTGAFPDARIASAATWNAKLSTVTADSTSRAANTFYAAPNGSAGAATFRAIVAADVPTLNQNTTGSAAKWTTARSISMTGDVSWTVSVDGSANATAVGTLASIITAGGPVGSASRVPVFSYDAKGRLTSISDTAITPAAIGALAAGGTAVNSSALGGVGSAYFVQGNGAGPYGHRTTSVTSFNTLLPSGFYDNINGIPSLTPSWTHMIRSAHTDPNSGSSTWSFDIAANFFTPVNGYQEGYYVRVNEGSSWGTWRTLWHSGNLTSATLPGGPYVPLAGGTMNNGASIAFLATGDVRFTAYGLSGMFNGNADNATYSAYNLKLKSWWGIGFESYDGVTRTVLDTRTGNLSTLGSIGCAGLAVTGTLSATSTLAWGGGGAIGSSGHVVQGVNDTRSTNSGSWTSVLPSGFYDDASAGNTPSGSWCYMINTSHTESGPGNQYQAQLATNFWGDNMWFRRITSGSVGAWRELWHSGNLTSATLPGGPYLPLAGGTVTGATTFSSGFTVPQSAIANFGNSEIHREASYMGLWGKGVPWQFGRGYTVYTSPNNVTATFNEGIDCLRGVWTDSLFVRTEFYPASSTWSSTSNYTLPVMAPGEQRVIFINATACSVYANGSQTVNYRSFSTGDMRQAAVNARVDSAGSFGYGSTTTVHSFLLICLDSSRVTLIC